MGIFFPPDYGVLEINSWHSDNEIYCRDVRFAIPIEKWSEFESSPMYQELSAYVEGLQTQDTRCENYEPECTEENEKNQLRDLMLKNFGTEEKGNAVTKKGVPTMRKGFWSKNFAKR